MYVVRMPKQLSGVVLQREALNSIFEIINQFIRFGSPKTLTINRFPCLFKIHFPYFSFLDSDNSKFLTVLNYVNRAEVTYLVRSYELF